MRLAILCGLAAFAVVWATPTARAQPRAPGPMSFARGFVLEVPDTGGGLYRTTLPRAVYRGVAHADLRDLRVFNSRGVAVPHALRPVREHVHVQEHRTQLPLFPLRVAPLQPSAPIEVDVNTQQQGPLVRVVADVARLADSSSSPGAMLLDATSVQGELHRLEFHAMMSDPEVWANLAVEASDDLHAWTPVGQGVVADLVHDGQRLSHTKVEVDVAAARKYLRVTASHGVLPDITRVVAYSRSRSSHPVRTTVTARGTPDGTAALMFDLGGHFPAVALRLELFKPTTLVKGTLLASRSRDQGFERRAEDQLFQTHADATLADPPVELNGTRDRHFRLELDPRTAGAAPVTARLHVDYRADEVLWLAQGQGPFVLAHGSVEASDVAFAATELIGGRPQAEIALAPLSGARTLGGDERLVPPLDDDGPDWARFGLWGVLVVAALLLVGLGVRLASTATP